MSSIEEGNIPEAALPKDNIELIRQKLEDKCGILDKALLQQFQTDYTKPRDPDLATFQVWGSSIVDRLKTNFIMAYNQDEDTMIVPQNDDYGDYNVCAHEMTHTLLDTQAERIGILLLPDYSGPNLEEIESYAKKRVEGREFDVVREQQELHILGAEINRFSNKIVASLQSFKDQYEAMNAKIKTIKERLIGYGIEPVTLSQQEKMDATKGVRLEYIHTYKDKNREFVDYLAGEFMQSMNAFQELAPQAITNPQYLVSKEFQGVKSTLMQRFKILVALLNQVQEATIAYIQEAERGYQEIEEIIATNKKKWYRNMQESLTKSTDSQEQAEIQEKIDLGKKLDEINQVTGALGGVLGDFGKFNSGTTHALDALEQEVLFQNAKSSAERIIGEPGEVIARLVDSLYSLYLGPVDQNNFPLTQQDLDFLATMTYKGEKIFRKGIEKYTVALEMQEDGVSIDDIRKQLVSVESFEYRGVQYDWKNTPFHFEGDIPFVRDIGDIVAK